MLYLKHIYMGRFQNLFWQMGCTHQLVTNFVVKRRENNQLAYKVKSGEGNVINRE